MTKIDRLGTWVSHNLPCQDILQYSKQESSNINSRRVHGLYIPGSGRENLAQENEQTNKHTNQPQHIMYSIAKTGDVESRDSRKQKTLAHKWVKNTGVIRLLPSPNQSPTDAPSPFPNLQPIIRPRIHSLNHPRTRPQLLMLQFWNPRRPRIHRRIRPRMRPQIDSEPPTQCTPEP